MQAKPRSPYFKRVIDALALASPFCLAPRFENGMAHCVEASISAASALGRWKVKARPIPCAIEGFNPHAGAVLAVGLTAKELYDRHREAVGGDVEPFQEWVRAHGARLPAEDGFVAHMVVEARFQGERALVDLTFGQLRGAFGIAVPMHHIGYGEGWPTLEVEGWRLSYLPSRRAHEQLAEVAGYDGRGYASDVKALMEVALGCDCEPDAFFRILAGAQPEQFRLAMQRLGQFATGTGT